MQHGVQHATLRVFLRNTFHMHRSLAIPIDLRCCASREKWSIRRNGGWGGNRGNWREPPSYIPDFSFSFGSHAVPARARALGTGGNRQAGRPRRRPGGMILPTEAKNPRASVALPHERRRAPNGFQPITPTLKAGRLKDHTWPSRLPIGISPDFCPGGTRGPRHLAP